MKTNSTILLLFLLLGLAFCDPHPLQDYCVASTKSPRPFFINGAPCIDPETVDASHFTTSALKKPGDTKSNIFGFNATLTSVANLPGVNTMGLTVARIDIAGNGIVPPHWHPRASEVTLCLQGVLLVGFVDTSNRLFTRELRPGESFVFPKGLLHFLYNMDSSKPALAISGFSSQNPGAQLASVAAFRTNPKIPDEVLKKSFQIDGQVVSRIRKNLGG